MASTSISRSGQGFPRSLWLRVLIGAAIALTLTILFISGGDPNPAWPKYWMIRPLFIIPLAGATGGACSYYLSRILNQTPWQKLAAIVISLIVYVIGLWLGSVLGFVGTYWN